MNTRYYDSFKELTNSSYPNIRVNNSYIDLAIKEKLNNYSKKEGNLKLIKRLNKSQKIATKERIEKNFKKMHIIVESINLSMRNINYKIEKLNTNISHNSKPRNLKINMTNTSTSSKTANPFKKYIKILCDENTNYFNKTKKQLNEEYIKIKNEEEERRKKIEKLAEYVKKKELKEEEKNKIKEQEPIFITNIEEKKIMKKKIKLKNLPYKNFSNITLRDIIQNKMKMNKLDQLYNNSFDNAKDNVNNIEEIIRDIKINKVNPVNLIGLNRLNRVIKNYIFTKDKKNKKDKKCCICLENISKHDNIMLYPCFHIFHRKCILEWIKIKSSCPMCKFDINLFL